MALHCRSSSERPALRMPLCKIFTRSALRVSADELHGHFARIWGVPKPVCKVLILPALDMSSNFPGEDVYVDIRAKAKADRTPENVSKSLAEISDLLHKYGHPANIRIELYDEKLQLAHWTALDASE